MIQRLIALVLLLACTSAPRTRAQLHAVGGSLALGRTHQLGTPGGRLSSPHLRLHPGTHQAASLWYENRSATSPWTLAGGLTAAYRSYWLARNQRQSRLLVRELDASGPGYLFFSAWLLAGRRLVGGERLALEGLFGLGVATAHFDGFGSRSSNGGQASLPADLQIDYLYDPDEPAAALVEPVLGLRLRHRCQARVLGRLAWIGLVHLPTRSWGGLGYRIEDRQGGRMQVYESQWRTRLTAWSVGFSYDLFRWGDWGRRATHSPACQRRTRLGSV